MKNNKGFTLIQLIVCLIIMGLIIVFVVPKINETILNKKKDKMIEDAKLFVEKTKEYIESGKGGYPSGENIVRYNLNLIDLKSEIVNSPFKGVYDREYVLSDPYTSYITIENSYNGYKYGMCLTDTNYTLNIVLDQNEDISILDTKEKYEKINKHEVGDCFILE